MRRARGPPRAPPTPPCVPAPRSACCMACRSASRTSSTSRTCRRRRARAPFPPPAPPGARPAPPGRARPAPPRSARRTRRRSPLATRRRARAFAHTRPTRDATCVARLRAAGAIVLGKTHTTQFAYRDPAPTANPWNPAHTPGGSSSGSAAAVAARTVPVALGSQTVGSILRPAAYTGIVGLKGTNGLVPLDGVVPLGYSLDHIGPLARSVEDAALVLSVMAARSLAPEPLEAPRLAVARELFDRAEPELLKHLEGVIARLATAGARVEEVRLPPSFANLAEAALVILETEAAT